MKHSAFFFIKYYFRWRRSLRKGSDSVSDQLPWMNFAAVDYLEKIVQANFAVFEYGSGGSTFFWSRRVKVVKSVEHDADWADKMNAALVKKRITNVELFLVTPTPDDNYEQKNIAEPSDYISDDSASLFYSYSNYVKKIRDYEDQSFEVIVIDGRSRPSCIIEAMAKVKHGGYLVVDNTEREYYLSRTLPVLRREGWKQIDFIAPVPYLSHYCKTTVFIKP